MTPWNLVGVFDEVKTLATAQVVSMVHNRHMIEPPQLASGNPSLQKAMDNLVKAENIKLRKVDERLQKEEAQLQLVRDLKGRFNAVKTSLEPFQRVQDFRDLVGVSSKPEILSATVDKTKAFPGTYEFEVISLARTDSIMTYGFKDRNKSEVGVGYIKVNTPDGGSRSIYINSKNNTLDGVAAAINSSDAGIRAHVVNDGTDADAPWRLVLTGEKTGWRENFEYPKFYMLDGDLDLDVQYSRDAASAKIRFNGQPMYVDNNTISDLLPGVSIDLKSAQEGQIVKFEVKPDVEQIELKAKEFVDSVNNVFGFFQEQNPTLDPTNEESKKQNVNRPRLNDTALLGVSSRFRDLIQKTTNNASEVSRLQDIGITFNRNGTLDFDQGKFNTQLSSNFDQVAELFSGQGNVGGFAREMVQLVDMITRSGDGTMTMRERGLQERIQGFERRKENEATKAEQRVQKTREQLARAEASIEQMNRLGASLPQAPGGLI